MSDLPPALIYTFPNLNNFPNLYNCHFLYITSTQPLIAATTCANTNHSTENGKRAVDDEEGLGPVSQLAQKGNNLLRVKKHPQLKSSSSASSSSSEKIVTLISSSNYHPDKM